MKRLLPSLVGLAVTACSMNMGGPKDIAVPTTAVRAAPGSSAADVASAIGGSRAAFVMGPTDSAWYAGVADAAGLTLSGPLRSGDIGLSFMAMKPVGDTVVELRYAGGQFQVLDALYDLGKKRYLDLLSFRVDHADHARAIVASLLEYVATDVDPTAAVAMAVAVPSPVVGDSVARMLTPGFFDALKCGDPTRPESSNGMRLFYGPEARLYCRSASTEQAAVGTVVHARLVAGRRE